MGLIGGMSWQGSCPSFESTVQQTLQLAVPQTVLHDLYIELHKDFSYQISGK